jgi:hypothetical protein
MNILRRFVLAFVLSAGLAPAFAQAPAPVPGLPDSERRTSYTISSQTGPFSTGFALYADSNDYGDWVQVWLCTSAVLNPCTQLTAVSQWTLSSPSGSLATLPRPITDATITLTTAQTGTLQIVGARRPRRISQFTENRGVAARDLNVVVTDLVAQNREDWDLARRTIQGQPGEVIAPMQPASTRKGGIPCWDGTGLVLLTCAAGSSGTANVVGPNVSVIGHIATFGNTIGTLLTDGGLVGAGNVVGPASATDGAFALYNGTSGVLLKNGPTVIGLTNGGTGNALTASNGGIAYSDASSIQILSGTATARQMLQSGSSVAPAWSTATWPATTTANQLLYSSATNTVGGLATAASGVLVTDGSGVPSISSTLPSAVQGNITSVGTITSGSWSGSAIPVANGGTGGTSASGTLLDNITGFASTGYVKRTGAGTYTFNNPIPLADGGTNANLTASNGGLFYSTGSAGAILSGTGTANQIPLSGSNAAPSWSITTWPNTVTTNNILYASSSNAISGLATGNNGTLVTSAGGVPSISSTLPTAVQSNITQLGTISAGVWNGSAITGSFIATNTVTNSNLATAANLTVKSNISGSTGNDSDNTLSAVLDAGFSSAQGTILYRNATNWAALPPGNPGQFLTTQGSSANPNWGSGGAGTGTVTTVNCDGVAITASGTCPPHFGFANCSLAASVSGNNLTVALKDNAGNDPSANSPCTIWFRNVTASTGSWSQVTTTAATSFVANAGSTFGILNSVAQCDVGSSCPFRLWVTAINNAGTVVLGVVAVTNASGVRAFNPATVVTTTACSACVNATAIGTMYSTAAQTSKAWTPLGYLEWGSGLATAGTYASGPTAIVTYGPGVSLPGAIIQQLQATATSQASTTSASFSTALTQAVTPTASSNIIRVVAAQTGKGTTGVNTGSIGIFNSTSSTVIAQGPVTNASGTIAVTGGLEGYDAPGSTSSQSFILRVRSDGTNTTVACSATNTGDNCTLTVYEIQGALPEIIPDNDNDPRLLNKAG